MTNYLLFNNLSYNKLINKKTIESHPNKDLFINIFILLIFVIGISLFLSYRYNNKINQDTKISLKEDISEEDNEDNKSSEDNKNNENNNMNNKNMEKNIKNILEKKNINKVKIDTEKEVQNNNGKQNNYLNDIQNNNFIDNIDIDDEKYSSIIN